MSKILVTAKISPDLDGVACAYAYAKLLNFVDQNNEYIAGIYGEPQIEAKYLLDRFSIKEGLIYNPEIEFAKFILVDASDIKGMPECLRAQDVLEVIDHREVHQAQELFPNAKVQIEKVGAAATLIFEKFKEKNITLDLPTAILLLGAIYSNTLNFQSNIVKQRDKNAVEFLKNDYGVEIPQNLIEEMFLYKTEYLETNLEEAIISDFKDFENGLSIAQLEGFNLVNLVDNKLEEIKNILSKLKAKYNLKYIFLTCADIKNNHNIFVVIDEKTKLLLSKSMGLSFDDRGIATNNKLILRKQIMPLLINNI